MKPLQLAFYKGMKGRFGAIQLKFNRPHFFCPRCNRKDRETDYPISCIGSFEKPHEEIRMETREGSLFLDMCSVSGPNIYDWDNKVMMTLSITDMATILFALETGEEKELMHDPGAKGPNEGVVHKFLKFSFPKGIKEGCLVNIRMKNKETEKEVSHMVPLSGSETKMLAVFIRHSLPLALAW